jgi:type II secretory pathway pseudopilin PulG
MSAGGRSDEGFTLVEVLAAVVVFVAVSAVTVALLISALGTIDENNERVLVANVARSQVEHLRALGATSITPGLTYEQPPGTPPGYVVETSAQWVGAGQQASACEAASPGQAYLRVRVAASSPELGAPAVIDTVITPEASVDFEGTAALAVSVVDHQGTPVPGVTVTALDAQHPENSFTYVTGADGCLYIPGLTAGGDIDVVVTKAGYVSSTPTGSQGTSSLDASSLAKPTFLLAPAAGVAWASRLTDFPLASGTPVTWLVNETGAVVETGAVGTAVTGRWPTTSGFTAWAGACADADPEESGAARPSFDFVAGGTTAAGLDVRPVRIEGLPPGTEVTARHAAGCSTPDLVVGVAGADGAVQAGLPNGDWEFRATAEGLSETVLLENPLAPPAAGVDETVALVPFTLAAQLAPTPSPSPSGTESPSPSPSGSP